ncbi:TonB-dependent receptor [Pseudoxanthomonas sacheonensis]|uniref:Catecholate siderophore receptor n=1 Tax=Pseudoxanthomonas sacheonensis TaxID=443615 RepID=A0ABU1RMI0_9GAMM|nr:TonB-dependent siderophore receptor [Pseudoxanthomonas sacheonensis]MDR6839981.1 catecholate siderophore receptor [Pseudoxanthomonas sacheonensis]
MNSTLRLSPLAAALLLVISTPALADLAPDKSATELDAVEVQGAKIDKPSSPKYTEALLDTPQTITVVNKATMDQQGLIGLRDVLSTLPGITFGAGEGGGGYGDSINLRGFTANSDITTDGVRDSAQYSRTDNFNLESIELVNGANSVYSGAGSVGGNINLVSKAAHEIDSHAFTIGAGTDGYGRVTADSNFDLDNGTAVRLNAMAHQNDVPGRDYEEFKRWGFAPSVAFGLGSDTRFTLSYFHQSDENTPQYGVPYYRNAFYDGPLPGVDSSNYYGYHNVDKQEIDVDMLTGVFEHDFNEQVTLRSLARYQKVDQVSTVDATQGTWCMPNNLTPTGTSCTVGAGAAAITVPVGQYMPTGPRGYVRDTSNAIAISQTDLTARFNTGSVEHALVAGVSFSQETFDLDTSNLFRNTDGSNPYLAPNHLPFMDIYNPDSLYTGPLNKTLIGRTEGTLNNQAIYVFDTLKFNDKLSLNLGARYEHNKGDSATWNVKLYTAPTVSNPNPDNTNIGSILSRATPSVNEEDLFSYRAGLVYKPVENGTIYLSYANSKTPSKASVNGTCVATSTTGTANCEVDPETAVNIELGAKWELLDHRLAVNAALFQNERENYRVNDPDPTNLTGLQSLDGRARVRGLALGVAGNITREWSLFANYTYLDSEVLTGVSDFCYANPSAACANSAAHPDPLKGNPLTNTPKHSASLWTTYRLNDWTFGYGATYQGEFYLNNSYVAVSGTTVSETALYKTPDYWTHRAMIGYQINDNIGLQLNVNNLFDEEYYTRIRNNGWATPGEGRSAVLSATFTF